MSQEKEIAQFQILSNGYTDNEAMVFTIQKVEEFPLIPVYNVSIEYFNGNKINHNKLTFKQNQMKQISEAIKILIEN